MLSQLNQHCLFKKIYIVGTGGHARVILNIVQEILSSINIIAGFIEVSDQMQEAAIVGIPVVGYFSEVSKYCASTTGFILAIGDNQKRRLVYEQLKTCGGIFPNLVAETAYVAPTAELGEGNVLTHGAYIGPYVKIGHNNLINTNAIVEHESTIGSNCHIAPGSIIAGRSHLRDEILLGLGAKMLPNLKIESHIVIGAGAVVTRDLIHRGTYIGIPARRRTNQ